MLHALMLIAQVEEKAAEPGPVGIFQNPMFLVLALVAMFFFIVILPQQRRERKQRDSLLTNLKRNDEIVTSAGIIGVVTNIKEGADEVTLKIDDSAKMRVLKSSIVRILTKETKEGA